MQDAIQDHYSDDLAWCYGCGRRNEQGHHFRTKWNGNNTVTEFEPKSEHMAVPGFVYGGVIASLIDCHSSGSCSIGLLHKQGFQIEPGIEPPRFVAALLNVKFVQPTPQGCLLKAVGELHEVHPKRWRVTTQVFAGDVVCATGEFEGVVMPKTFSEKA